MAKPLIILKLVVFILLPLIVSGQNSNSPTATAFSRVIIYDVRGMNRDESTLILEKKNHRIRVLYRNYLGQRHGSMPVAEYDKCFSDIIKIKKFALRKKHRGRLLRRNAAKGSITLAWKSASGEKEIKTISYYAPENTLDDFRLAFNQLWALSRYAILSLHSFENSKLAYREDGLYFMSGSGWMTKSEIDDVIAHHLTTGRAYRVAKSIWSILNQPFSTQSEFNNRSYLIYCVKKSMLAIGHASQTFLQSTTFATHEQNELAQVIISELNKTSVLD